MPGDSNLSKSGRRRHKRTVADSKATDEDAVIPLDTCSDAEEEEPPPKRHASAVKQTCLRSSGDPDVTIVVGGVEYLEYSQSLRCWSGYFDAAFRSGCFKESKSKRFSFPDRTASEWEWIVALAAPFSTEKITQENVFCAISWFDELLCPLGLKACDAALSDFIEGMLPRDLANEAPLLGVEADANRQKLQAWIQEILDTLNKCMTISLPESKKACIAAVQRCLNTIPAAISKPMFGRIVEMVKDSDEIRKEFWNILQTLAPDTTTEDKLITLMEHDMLHEILFLETERRHSEARKEILSLVFRRINEVPSYSLKGRLRVDKVIGPLIPNEWRKNWG